MGPIETEFEAFKSHMMNHDNLAEMMGDAEASKFLHAIFYTGAFVCSTLITRLSVEGKLAELASLLQELDEFHGMAVMLTNKTLN